MSRTMRNAPTWYNEDIFNLMRRDRGIAMHGLNRVKGVCYNFYEGHFTKPKGKKIYKRWDKKHLRNLMKRELQHVLMEEM